MSTLTDFMKNDATRIDEKIYALYEEFKVFICCRNLPHFIIQYVDDREDTKIFFRALVTVFHEPIIMFYNINGYDKNNDDFEADLIHEFTHLYDYHMQKQMYDKQFIRNNFSMYSEYHAVQIEILYRCHVVSKITDKINTDVNISKFIKIVSWKAVMYMTYYKKYNENKTEDNLSMLKKTYFYLSGAISIARELTNNFKFELPEFISPYKDIVQEGINLLWSVKYSEIPTESILKRIGEINLQV